MFLGGDNLRRLICNKLPQTIGDRTEEIQAAHRLMESNEANGKIVVRI